MKIGQLRPGQEVTVIHPNGQFIEGEKLFYLKTDGFKMIFESAVFGDVGPMEEEDIQVPADAKLLIDWPSLERQWHELPAGAVDVASWWKTKIEEQLNQE